MAIQNILDDDSFKLNSPVAAEARQVAESLLKWSSTEFNNEKILLLQLQTIALFVFM